MTRILSILFLALFAGLVRGQTLSRGEYFVDTDPGFGLGQSIAIPAGSSITSLTFQPNLQPASPGIHTVGCRVLDSQGKWSQTNTAFYYLTPAISLSNVVSLEYFIDSDPGFGNGISLNVPSNFVIGSLSFNLNLSGLTQGIHYLHVRGKNALGIWSQLSSSLVYRLDTESISNLKRLEYFFDADPGFGNGQPLVIPMNVTVSGALSFNVGISSLSEGIHQMFVRGIDAHGNWSQLSSTLVFKQSALQGAAIDKVEYFFDVDPGFDQGVEIPVSSGDIQVLNPQLSTLTLSDGVHVVGWRVKNNLKHWSMTHYSLFFKTKGSVINPIVRAEYFIDVDPGIGEANPFSVPANGGEITQFAQSFDVSGLSGGNHRIFWRTQDNLGKWSQTYSRPFSICSVPYSVSIVQPTCANSNNGSVSISIPATYAPTFSWTPSGLTGGNTSTISNLQPGTYSCVISTNSGCSITQEVNVLSTVSAENVTQVTSCGPYTWNGQQYSSSGSYSVTSVSPEGCSVNNILNLVVSNGQSNYFVDDDNDGFGSGNSQSFCTAPISGFSSISGDCNDNNASIKPGATEICGNGIDEDCSGADLSCSNAPTVLGFSPSEACSVSSLITISGTNLSDVIEVQIGGVTSGGIMSSSATEIVVMLGYGQTGNITVITSSGSAISNDLFTVIPSIYYSYEDADGDSYGDPSTEFIYCEIPFGYVSNNTDCVDNNSAINPGASETCNNLDDDCDGTIDNGLNFVNYYNDLDGDTYGAGTATNACQSPGATYVTNNTDCNNNNAAIKPGATEICGNGIDEDCSGADLVCAGTGDLTLTNVLSIGNYGTGAQTTFGLHFTSGTDNIESPGPGADIWYQFTAQANAIRIQLNGATNADDDLDVALYDYTTTTGEALIPLHVENDVTPTNLGISTDGGNEILYYDQLEVGSTYWICVRNVNNTYEPATMRIAYLRGSAMDIGPYTNYTNTYSSTCQNFKCKYKPGASYYTFNLWNGSAAVNEPYWIYSTAPATTNVASTVVQLGKLVAANINNIPIQHTVKVDAHYALKDAYGNTEQVVGYGITPGVFTLNTEADLNLRTTDRCPVYKRPTSSSIATNRSVCGTSRFIWQLALTAPSAGLPQIVNGPMGGSRVLGLGTIQGINNNQQYNVSIASLHNDQQTQSNYGSVQCMRTTGFAGAPVMEEDNTYLGEKESKYFIYPNPNQGEGVTINLAGMEGEINMALMDGTGRLLEKTTWNVKEYAQREWRFETPLSSGLYEVRIQQGSRQETQRMLVVR